MKKSCPCLLLGMFLPTAAVAQKLSQPVVTIAKVLEVELTEDISEVQGSSKLFVNPGSKDGPSAYNVAADGSVYVIDAQYGQIKHFDKAGRLEKSFGEYGSFQGAVSIAVDREQDIYVVSRWKDSPEVFELREFDSDLRMRRKLAVNGRTSFWFMTVDMKNQLHVVNTETGAVVVLEDDRQTHVDAQLPPSKTAGRRRVFISRKGETSYRERGISRSSTRLTPKKQHGDTFDFEAIDSSVTIGPIVRNEQVVWVENEMRLKVLDIEGNLLVDQQLGFRPLPGQEFVEGFDDNLYLVGWSISKQSMIWELWKISIQNSRGGQ